MIGKQSVEGNFIPPSQFVCKYVCRHVCQSCYVDADKVSIHPSFLPYHLLYIFLFLSFIHHYCEDSHACHILRHLTAEKSRVLLLLLLQQLALSDLDALLTAAYWRHCKLYIMC